MQKNIKRFFSIPDNSCFIFGPRGSGKSTWIKQNLKNALVVNLLNEVEYYKHLANPGYIREIVDGNKDKFNIFVVDEIQKIPQILDTIHDLIEEDKRLRFVLTGSSARKLKRAGVNLLAGRAIHKKMHPFMAAELAVDFDLEMSLEYGLVPLIIKADNPADTIASYISLYLKEEVQTEGLVRNIGDFARFLQVISFSHGGILNLNNIARESVVSRKIVENYLSILDDLLLSYTLPVFSKKAKREVVSHPKFYYFDAGIYNNLRPKGPLDKPTEIVGMALEGLVLQHLSAWNDYSTDKSELFYWRTKAGSEVDFIVYGEKYFMAIEVKNSSKVYSQDLTALKSFITDYPEATPILLYRGQDKIVKDGIKCIPVKDFLLQLKPNANPLI
jgi:predicted AAA+ superfamily ATPase